MRSTYSSDHIVKVLRRQGFYLVHQRGSHAKYRSESKSVRTVILPMGRKDMRLGTFRSVIEQAGLSESDFGKH